jgi:hypothetical protein
MKFWSKRYDQSLSSMLAIAVVLGALASAGVAAASNSGGPSRLPGRPFAMFQQPQFMHHQQSHLQQRLERLQRQLQ